MSTYNKVNKETATYTEVDKADAGWFRQGWFSKWFGGLYRKIEKEISTYTKVNK